MCNAWNCVCTPIEMNRGGVVDTVHDEMCYNNRRWNFSELRRLFPRNAKQSSLPLRFLFCFTLTHFLHDTKSTLAKVQPRALTLSSAGRGGGRPNDDHTVRGIHRLSRHGLLYRCTTSRLAFMKYCDVIQEVDMVFLNVKVRMKLFAWPPIILVLAIS